jgi:hypothetical protein
VFTADRRIVWRKQCQWSGDVQHDADHAALPAISILPI